MSKRNKKGRNTPASTDNGSDLTLVDGNAVGLAPEGGAGDAGTEVVEAADTNDNAEIVEIAEPVVAEDVLAALAADETPPTVTTTDADEPTITAEDVDEPTEDEVLAAIDASGTTPKSRKSSTTPKEPAQPMREFTAVAAIDEQTLQKNLDGCNAKKVREKADNLIAAVTHGKKLSRYTAVAVSELMEHGRFSGKSMTERFKTEGLSEGTARAQAQQMTALFKLVGAAAPDANAPRDLVLQDNGLVEELAKIAA